METQNDVFGEQLAIRKRTSIWKVLGLTLLTFGVAAGTWLRFTESGRNVSSGIRAMSLAKSNPNLIFDRAGSDHVNILLIGRDVNWKPAKVMGRPFHVADKDTSARSDTMIVVSLDKTNNTIRMVSLPRDALVHLPDNKYDVSKGKLNAAHAYGGPELLIQTLHDQLGLTIHDYAVIKFEGFKKLIDQVGGVTVDVDGALKRHNGKLYRGDLDYDDNWGNLHIHLKPGMQRLDGQKAHDYVRFRMDLEGDPGRIRRQQQVMRALAKEIMHQSPWRIPGLVTEVRRQFETTLQDDEIASAAMFAKNLGDSQKIQPLTLFGVYTTRGSLILNKEKNIKLLSTIFGSSFNADNFLADSPSTEGDEIGVTNNRSPEARAVLLQAGLLDDADGKPNAEMRAPVIDESASRSAYRDRSREDATEKQIEEARERRRRRETKRSEQTEATRPQPQATATEQRKPEVETDEAPRVLSVESAPAEPAGTETASKGETSQSSENSSGPTENEESPIPRAE